MNNRSLSLDELVAVNAELAALVRAGVPLELTLGEMGRDMPGRLGRATSELAGRIAGGASLPQALEAMPGVFPVPYRKAVEAGLRAGRLPAVLEDLAHAARNLSELRRTVALAALYPAVVLLLTYELFVFFTAKVVPVLIMAFEGRAALPLRAMAVVGEWLSEWVVWIHVGLGVVLAIALYQFARGRAGFSWLPVVGRMLRDSRVATFSEILSLLLQHDVPLHEAMPLAADVCGDRRLAESANTVAEQLVRGVAVENLPADADMPPFFLWLAGTGQQQDVLVSLLQQTAETYRRRVMRRAH